MVAVVLGTVWAGYYLTMYGYCLVRGYDVSFTQLAHTHWPSGGQGKPWNSTLGAQVARAAREAVGGMPLGKRASTVAGGAFG